MDVACGGILALSGGKVKAAPSASRAARWAWAPALVLCGCAGGGDAVPRSLYDELAERHRRLEEEMRVIRNSTEAVPAAAPAAASAPASAAASAPAAAPGGEGGVLAALSGVRGSGDLKETVDVFAAEAPPAPGRRSPTSMGAMAAGASPAASAPGAAGPGPGGVEGDIARLRAAAEAVESGRSEEEGALAVLRELERSSGTRQVRARAKFQIGELFFKQGEYDLAMQEFEGVLANHAFSGVVLRALERLVDCSERLIRDEGLGRGERDAQREKRDRYSSLRDFFVN